MDILDANNVNDIQIPKPKIKEKMGKHNEGKA